MPETTLKSAADKAAERGERIVTLADGSKITMPTNVKRLADIRTAAEATIKTAAMAERLATLDPDFKIDPAVATAATEAKRQIEAIESLANANAHVAHATGNAIREAIHDAATRTPAAIRTRIVALLRSIVSGNAEAAAAMLTEIIDTAAAAKINAEAMIEAYAAIMIEEGIGAFATLHARGAAEGSRAALAATLHASGDPAYPFRVSMLRQVTERQTKADKIREAVATFVRSVNANADTEADKIAATLAAMRDNNVITAEAATFAINLIAHADKIDRSDKIAAPNAPITNAPTEAEAEAETERTEATAEKIAAIEAANAEADTNGNGNAHKGSGRRNK